MSDRPRRNPSVPWPSLDESGEEDEDDVSRKLLQGRIRYIQSQSTLVPRNHYHASGQRPYRRTYYDQTSLVERGRSSSWSKRCELLGRATRPHGREGQGASAVGEVGRCANHAT